MKTKAIVAQERVQMTDPHDCTDNADTVAILSAGFDAMVKRERNGGYAPALATQWTLSSNAKTWEFTLRPNLRFHDGSALDGAAMVYSIERMMRPDIGATLGAPAVWGQYLGGAKVHARDECTVVVTTQEPCADLLDILVSAYALPPHLADTQGFVENPVGSGAYRFDEVRQGEVVRMSANPDDWRDTPANQTLEWRQVPGAQTRLEALRAGTANVASRLAATDAAELACSDGFCRLEHLDPTAIIYLLNATHTPFDDPRTRLAINLAVDRNALIADVLGGSGSVLTGIVSQIHAGGLAPRGNGGCDREQARRLLAQAGHAQGLNIVVDCPTSLPDEAQQLTTALGRQLAEVGVQLDVKLTTDRVAYAEKVRDSAIHDMCLFDSSPLSTFRVLSEKIDSRVQGSWWQGYANQALEALLDQARRETDLSLRHGIYTQACTLLHDDPPWLSVYNHMRNVVIRAAAVNTSMVAIDGAIDASQLPAMPA